MQATTRERKWWTKSEDEVLQAKARLQIDKHGSVINWSDIASNLPGRSNKDCRKRWYKVCLDIRRGAWMPEEDERLQKAVAEAGLKWTAVSQIMQTRNADQCAKRWQQVIGPDIKHTPWTSQEDEILQRAIAKYGNNWKQVGLLELPGRSAHDIRNRVALSRRNRRPSAATRQPNASSTASQSRSPASCTDLAESGEGPEEQSESDTDVTSNYHSYAPSVDMGFYAGVDGAEDWALPEIPDLPSALDGSTGDSFTPNWEMLSSVDPLLSLSTPPQDAGTPFWESVTVAAVQTSGGAFDETHIDPALQNEYTVGSVMEGKDLSQQIGSDAGLSSFNLPTAQNPNAESNCVTVVLRRADPNLTKEVVGNLVGLNANFTIHVIKD